MRRMIGRVLTYDCAPAGVVWDADTGSSIVQRLPGAPVAYYPQYGFGHAPLGEVQRRGGPEPDAIIGEVLQCWATADGVDALLEVLDGASRTALSMMYQRALWPRPGGDRVEIFTRIWALDVVARSMCGGCLVREADAALCWKLTGSVAPRGQYLERLAAGLALPARHPAAMITYERPAARLAEILSDDDCLDFTALAPGGPA